MDSLDVWSIVSVLFGAVVLLYVQKARKNGRILGQMNFIQKQDHPRIFLIYIILYTIIGIASISLPIALKILLDR